MEPATTFHFVFIICVEEENIPHNPKHIRNSDLSIVVPIRIWWKRGSKSHQHEEPTSCMLPCTPLDFFPLKFRVTSTLQI